MSNFYCAKATPDVIPSVQYSVIGGSTIYRNSPREVINVMSYQISDWQSSVQLISYTYF